MVQSRLPLNLAGKAKISNFDVKILNVIGDEMYAVGNDSPVYYILLVNVVKSEHELVDDIGGLSLCETG